VTGRSRPARIYSWLFQREGHAIDESPTKVGHLGVIGLQVVGNGVAPWTSANSVGLVDGEIGTSLRDRRRRES